MHWEVDGGRTKSFRDILGQPKRPVVTVVGGAKISTSALLENLIEKVDCMIIGGAMANTFFFRRGSMLVDHWWKKV